MTPQVNSQNSHARDQWCQNAPIGQPVKAIGVREDDIDRPVCGPKVQHSHFPAPRRQRHMSGAHLDDRL